MSDLSASDAQHGFSPDTAIYLEKDVFYDGRLGQLRAGACNVMLNQHENTLLRLLMTDRVRKQLVIDTVWGANGIIVTEASYHQLVRALRKKFTEAGLDPLSIKTLPRYGLEYLRARESPVSSILAPRAPSTSTTSPAQETDTAHMAHADHATFMTAAMVDEAPTPATKADAGPDAMSAGCRSETMDDGFAAAAFRYVPVDSKGIDKSGPSDTFPVPADIADPEGDAHCPAWTTAHAAVDRFAPRPDAFGKPYGQLLLYVRLSVLAVPLCTAVYFFLMTYLGAQVPVHAIANDWGIHLFDVGGTQHDPRLLQEIRRRSHPGEYVYVARNGPKAWLGICDKPTNKEFSFCRQDYFSLY